MNIHNIIESNNHNDIPLFINLKGEIMSGLVFIFPNWSADQRYLISLLEYMQKESIKTPVYIFDLDDDTCKKFEHKYQFISQGKGEIFFLNNKEIVYRILQHNKENSTECIEKLFSKIIPLNSDTPNN